MEQDDEVDRVETLTAYFVQSAGDRFDLRLPYDCKPGEEFPFTEDMLCELHSESMGLGIRLTGKFDSHLSTSRIRVVVNNDLKAFQRRLHPRRDCRIGIRFTRGHGTLRSFRTQWEKNATILQRTKDFSKLPKFTKTDVNISAGGLRFSLKPPIEIADLCMTLIELEPGTPPVCALAEIVWLTDLDERGQRSAGMQFINVLASDQKRIIDFVNKAPKYRSAEEDESS
mgnify:FL=1